MSDIVLGCDDNGYNDAEYQSTVASILEKAGHNVEKCAIEPNAFASYSDGSNGKNPRGKIGIYLIAAGTYSIADATYGTSQFKYNYFGIRPECSPNWECSDFDTRPIGADLDCPGWLCSKIAGNSFKRINEIVKAKSMVVTGKDATEMGNNLVKAMGGEVSSDSENKNTDSGSTAKECVQKLLTHWDGDVECRIINDVVYINKIKDPKKNYKLTLQEGVNVYTDSISITDVNPNTVNCLIVTWTGGKITIKDEELISRFGEVKKEMEAVKKIINKVTKSPSTDTTSTDLSVDTENLNAGTDTLTAGTDTSELTAETKTTVVDEKITNYEDALSFANTEWNKIKRDNGHTIECQTRGSNNWKVGEWVRVVFPSFGENCFMYTTRVSQSDEGGDWNCNISLADYPPGWGKEEVQDNDNDDDENAGSTAQISNVVDQICREIGEFSYSGECSDADCIKSTKRGECWALSDYIYKRLKGAGIQAKVHQYATSSAGNHRQVSYNNGSGWVMFPYDKSGIDHYFYTNEIPSDTEIIAS